METPRLTPWRQVTARECQRAVITPHYQYPFVRLWGRNKKGVAEWYWTIVVAGIQGIDPEFSKKCKLTQYSYRISPPTKIFNRKIDAIRNADETLKENGFFLLKDKHLPFL